MATRIIIFNAAGRALYGLDGHHGSEHAAHWTAQICARLEAEGVDHFAVELQPSEGGDGCRRGVIGQLHRLRCELHRRPDGTAEIVGLHCYPDASPADLARESGATFTRRQTAALPDPVRGCLRAVAGSSAMKLPLQSLRLSRSRHSGHATAEALRQARRHATASRRQ